MNDNAKAWVVKLIGVEREELIERMAETMQAEELIAIWQKGAQ